MSGTDCIAFVLAGGKKPSLDILSRKRAKAAIPFGTIYRVIDFVLSNLMHSEISHVGVLTQYRPESLMDHIGDGEAWDWQGRRRGIKILPPYQRQENSDWYKGTADAVFQNLNFIMDRNPNYVLIVSGDHIYNLDYRKVIHHHLLNEADITIVSRTDQHIMPGKYGMLAVDDRGRVQDYQEKPEITDLDHISLGMYVFNTSTLIPLLEEDARLETSHDIGRDLISHVVSQKRVYTYNFIDPWYYLGDIRDYWDANMELTKENPIISLKRWGIETNLLENDVANLPPTRFRGNGSASNSIIANGCNIEGTVVQSVIYPGVTIGKGSIVKKSILMNDCGIRQNVSLNEVIADKNVIIENNANIGEGPNTANYEVPQFFNTGITVLAKNTNIAPGVRIGKNALIYKNIEQENDVIPSGTTHGGLK